jgi:hypothetical protein
MNDITGSLNNITSQLTGSLINQVTGSFLPKFKTIPFLSPDQINQETLKNIKTKEIFKLGSDLVLSIIK